MVNFYQPQINPLYCSVASSVIILNTLKNDNEIPSQKDVEIVKPKDLSGKKILQYKLYNQTSFLNAKTDTIKDKRIIEYKKKGARNEYDAGVSLTDLSRILSEVHDLKVEKIHAENNDLESIEEFRSNVKRYLSDNDHFILVNFKGSKIGLNTGGHISPITAYDQDTDSILVLDVAPYKDPWHFISLERLHEAMNTKDGDSYRGYLIISE